MKYLSGIDMVEIDRIARSLENPRFLGEVFGPEEQAELQKKGEKRRLESAAGAFAAKEAFGKALGIGLVGFDLNEVQILHNEKGAPYFALCGRAKALAEAQNLQFSLSITHTTSTAAAMVVAWAE